MKNFIFKSTAADLQKMFSILENLQKNMVYATYKLDNILKLVKTYTTNKDLQQQVDKYFDEDIEETSPQTDQSTKADLDWPLEQSLRLVQL